MLFVLGGYQSSTGSSVDEVIRFHRLNAMMQLSARLLESDRPPQLFRLQLGINRL
jgi:hypothetical protein